MTANAITIIISDKGEGYAEASSINEAITMIQDWHRCYEEHEDNPLARECNELWAAAVEAIDLSEYSLDLDGIEAYADALARHVGSQSCFGGSPHLSIVAKD